MSRLDSSFSLTIFFYKFQFNWVHAKYNYNNKSLNMFIISIRKVSLLNIKNRIVVLWNRVEFNTLVSTTFMVIQAAGTLW